MAGQLAGQLLTSSTTRVRGALAEAGVRCLMRGNNIQGPVDGQRRGLCLRVGRPDDGVDDELALALMNSDSTTDWPASAAGG